METEASRAKGLVRIARQVMEALQAPLPERPRTNDPREIDRYYIRRYAPRRANRAPQRAAETPCPGEQV